MSYKLYWLLISFSSLLVVAVYIILNPSYEKSFEARFYYSIGEYDKALSLSKEAFSLNNYNRMASTVMVQSQMSLQYIRYNTDAKRYMQIIEGLTKQESLSDSDKAKIKIMSEIVMEGYIKLSSSVVTDSSLVDEAANYHAEFVKINEKITTSL